MAHKTREPARAVRGKLTRPRDRGEKYVAPQILPGEEVPGWSRGPAAAGTVGWELRRRRSSRRGSAHELIRKIDSAILRELSRGRGAAGRMAKT